MKIDNNDSLEPSRQELVERLKKRPTPTQNDTWKSTTAGILMLISVISGMAISAIAVRIGLPPIVGVMILCVIPSLGGYYALKRKRYNWAFIGSIFSIISMPLLGIPAVILIMKSKSEFA